MNARSRLLGAMRPYRARTALSVLLMAIVAAATAGYAWMTGPLLHAMAGGSPSGTGTGTLLLLPAALLGLALVKGLGYFGQFYLSGLTAQEVTLDLRRALFDRLVSLAPADLARQRTGDLLSRFGADLTGVENALHIAVPTYLRDGLTLLALLGVCFSLDVRLSLLAFGLVPLAAFPLSRLFRRLRRMATRGQKSVGNLAVLAHETIAGVRVVQAYGMQKHQAAAFDRESARWLRLQQRSLFVRGLASPAMELLAAGGVALALAWAVRALSGGQLSGEKLVSFLATMALVFQPAKNLGKVGGTFLQGLASAERVFEVIDLRPAIAEAPSARALPPLASAIELSEVTVRFGQRLALDRLSLTIARGEQVALVGSSGSGKTTLASLILRSLDPGEGVVRFDGVDIRDATLASLRGQVALVPQETVLFDDTVRANVGYGTGASDADIRRALQAAGAAAFVQALPLGLETPVGERGASLSGGQRQRLAIARALLRDAPILVLDEATSALDSESEREVQAALETLQRGRTVIAIAHRLSTIARAHRICVLSAGRIVEEGAHEELLARGGEYARLWALQAAGEAA